MQKVRAKKYLGQHFLKDESIAKAIVDSLSGDFPYVLEIGAGMGVLTKYIISNPKIKELKVVEIDNESVEFLNHNFPAISKNIIAKDFLKLNLDDLYPTPLTIIGNFPYNISNQILFKVLDNRDKVKEVVGMFQKEVAQRVCAKSGNKIYGILSVLLSAYYDIEYLFTVDEDVFIPPPKVKSAVIRLKRNNVEKLDCDEVLLTKIVKTAFNQRRKMIRQSLKSLELNLSNINPDFLTKRAEQLNIEDYINITNQVNQIN